MNFNKQIIITNKLIAYTYFNIILLKKDSTTLPDQKTEHKSSDLLVAYLNIFERRYEHISFLF